MLTMVHIGWIWCLASHIPQLTLLTFNVCFMFSALPELNKVKDMGKYCWHKLTNHAYVMVLISNLFSNQTERIASDDCAFMVYVVCGSRFKDKLVNKEKIDPATLCNVFIEEGDCIKEQKGHYCAESASPILDRFQQNSKEAAKVVLPALCRIAA